MIIRNLIFAGEWALMVLVIHGAYLCYRRFVLGIDDSARFKRLRRGL